MLATFNLYTVSLFLHISAAIVGLGATFALSIAFPLAVRMKDPRHLLFMHKLNLEVVTKLAHAFHDWVDMIQRSRQLLAEDAAHAEQQEKEPA